MCLPTSKSRSRSAASRAQSACRKAFNVRAYLSRLAITDGAFCIRMSVQSAGSPEATRVVSRKPDAANARFASQSVDA